MISRLSVKNFQSLKAVDLTLSPFTVVVGDSSCGKSALVRAFQALASNIRGSSFVTIGESLTVISAQSEEWKVTLEKGENHGVYKLYDGINVEERDYTKLGGTVPVEVTEKLRILPLNEGLSLNFASQDDKPYLLSDSGQIVARELGELTNVSTLFSAVREANRRRTEKLKLLKTRKSDLVKLTEQAQKFKLLAKRKVAIENSEILYNKIEQLIQNISKLRKLCSELNREPEDIVQAPSVESVQTSYDMLYSYKDLLTTLATSEDIKQAATEQLEKYKSVKYQLEQDLHTALTDAGRCPLCDRKF